MKKKIFVSEFIFYLLNLIKRLKIKLAYKFGVALPCESLRKTSKLIPHDLSLSISEELQNAAPGVSTPPL